MNWQNTGFIGLGAMGTPMAHNLREAGYLRGVYNRTKAKTEPFAERAVSVYDSPKDLAAAADVVAIIVTDDAALSDVLQGDEGVLAGLQGGSVVINMSTVSHGATMRAARAVGERGGRFLDVPVSGTVGPAEQGTLTILAAGDKDLVDEATPVLKAMGEPIVYCGEVGQGTRTKLFINLMLGGLMQTFAEALAFGKKQGLGLEPMLDVVTSGPLAAPLFKLKGEMLKSRDFTKQFPVALLLKDMDLVLQEGREQGVYLPVSAAAREAVSGTQALGYGDEDMMALVKFTEKIAGLEPQPD